MDLFSQAQALGILTEFTDGQGQRHVTDEAALKIIVDAFPARTPRRFVDGPVVIRSGLPARTELREAARLPVRWKIEAKGRTVRGRAPTIAPCRGPTACPRAPSGCSSPTPPAKARRRR